MNKPLKDWTLGEIKQECKKHPGACCIKRDCPFMGDAGCVLERVTGDVPPYMWDLSEPPRWTEQEAEIAKALYELRRSIDLVIGRTVHGILWWRDGDKGEGILPSKLFPSLNEGNCVRLDEIIGGAE